jgi:hypothetical protein
MSDFYILVNDQESGPFALQELEAMIRQGEIPPETLYARPGMSAWEQLSKVVPADLDVATESATPPAQSEAPNVLKPEPTAISYDSSAYESLMETFQRLSTYTAVNEWDQRAQEDVKRIVEVLRGLDRAIAGESAGLDQARREFEQRSFLKRTFSGHDLENAIAARISNLRQRKVQLLPMVAQLQNAIDFTPNTPAQKDLLVKELRHRKKELQAQKREATAAMTAIRQEARVQSVHAGKTWLGLYDSELAAGQRRGIRYAKEAALRPHEDAKAAIDRQLIKVEKDLLWVEQFEHL